MNNRLIKCGIALFLLAVMIICIMGTWGNVALQTTEYKIDNILRLPASFDGFCIAQISDFHNTVIGNDNKYIIEAVKKSKPDIICFTGDLIDSYHTDIDISLKFVYEMVKIAPCYYVTGNHEQRISQYPVFKAELINAGVTVLEDDFAYIERLNEKIKIIGIDDPSFEAKYNKNAASVVNQKLAKLNTDEDVYTILLSHRPDLINVYSLYNLDLVLSGHAHGGQFRIPFIGGLYAPQQGLFPKYDAGCFKSGSTTVVVSRGIGNSVVPLRLNNRPELVLVKLTK